jgi:hypothetical protein
MTVAEFIAKWSRTDLKERSASQEHFLDLCALVGHPTPAAADPTGDTFCFERGTAKQGGGDGFADVWKKDCFAWEYKGRHKDLGAAYDQLLLYRDALASPPLLVTCDFDRIRVHTNFTGTVSTCHEIPLARLGEPRSIEILHAVFHDPTKLRPGRTSEAVTREAARQFAEIAAAMRQRGRDAAAVAHFLDRLVFCLFAEDIGLLPEMIFSRLAARGANDPARFGKMLGQLFESMATGGDFGLERIRHFNGNLFDDRTVLDVTPEELVKIAAAATLDWSAVDPSIFGTLFERGLDPAKRSQLGAHFTGRADIERVVDAVIMSVLRREWTACRDTVTRLLATGRKAPAMAEKPLGKPPTAGALRKARDESASLVHQFLTRLQNVKVLDPACGSGNFLYVALLRLKDLEKEAIVFAIENNLGAFLPMVGPWQLHGIEVNAYAHDLAQMTVWIGWLQWVRANGFGFPQDPVLRRLTDNIRLMDAILSAECGTASGDGPGPEWPKVDFIVGNPPFLGTKKLRSELGDAYVERLFAAYAERIPNFSDLCCYWFERARAHIAAGLCKRAGLLATQGIRGGLNREVLKRISETGGIFWAESDREWVLNGANVHVSMVGFDDGSETERWLDGKPVPVINPNLTALSDTTTACRLSENADIGFIADVKAGRFDVAEPEALALLATPNPHGAPSSDVIRPWINSLDVLRRDRRVWIVDFGTDMPCAEAALYQEPYRIVDERVRPERAKVKRERYREWWWLHAEPCARMRRAIASLPRFLVTPTVAKHRIFAWWTGPTLPDHQLVAFGRSDDLFFGVLHSRIHEVWALRMGTRLETRPRYTPSTCFETFPFPPGVIPETRALDSILSAIAAAARELNTLRERWLNPPEWTKSESLEFPASVDGPWRGFIAGAPDAVAGVRETNEGWTPRDLFEAEQAVRRAAAAARQVQDRGTIARYPRIVPRDAACARRLAARTLTRLYNERPAWLDTCHRNLDAAVASAYGWPADLTDDQILERLLALNLARKRSR